MNFIASLSLASMAAAFYALAGCATTASKADSRAVVSVSAVNYSRLGDREHFDSVNAPSNNAPETPAAPRADRPAYYLILPGEIYPSDMPIDSVYHQLEVSLLKRGYYSALAHVKSGHPLQIDYLLRLHYGIRPWLNPTVRPDRVTWGDDGLLAKRHKTRMASTSDFDSRQGLDVDEMNAMARLALKLTGGIGKGEGASAGADSLTEAKTFLHDEHVGSEFGDGTAAEHDFSIVVVEAFKFSDVKAMDTRAPCAWMIFIAVPVDNNEKFSALLPTMLKTGESYYGETTVGLQVHEVPTGNVDVGEPVEVKPASPDRNPSVNFGSGHPP